MANQKSLKIKINFYQIRDNFYNKSNEIHGIEKLNKVGSSKVRLSLK